MYEPDRFEKLDRCLYCQNLDYEHELTCKDLLNNTSVDYHLVKCKICGLVFQNPRIKKEYISEYYKDMKYYKPCTKKKNIIKLIISRALVDISKRFRRTKLIPDFVEDGKLLEIGSSHGERLEELKKLGWKDCIGIEMDKEAFKYAIEERKLNIINTRLEDFEIKEEYYDVIIMSMVLEHLYQPFEALEKICKGLRPGGQLLISIPYYNGVEYKIFKEYSYGLQLPTHITFFSKKILKEFLGNKGFDEIEFWSQTFERDFTASSKYKYEATGKAIYKLISSNRFVKYIFLKPIMQILAFLGISSRLSIYAKKKQ